MSLTDFVLARIAEREALAREAAGSFPDWVDGNEETLDGENVYFTVTATRGAGKAGAEWEPDYFLSVHEDRRDDARVYHIARWDPTAVLARCAVDRQIIAEHQQGTFTDVSLGLKDVAVCIKCHSVMGPPDEDDEDSWDSTWDDWKYPFVQDPWPCRTLRLLASLDANHPDYDESWKP